MALLTGVATVGSVFPFDQPANQGFRRSPVVERIGDLADELARQEVALYSSVNLIAAPGGRWTESFAEKRATTRGVITMTQEEAELLLRLARGCLDEFSGNWIEFETVAGGGLFWFKAELKDLEASAMRLERALADG